MPTSKVTIYSVCQARSSEQKSLEISLLKQWICHNKVESTRSHVFFDCNFSSYTLKLCLQSDAKKKFCDLKLFYITISLKSSGKSVR